MNTNQKKSYTLPIIMMILLFGMISFVTNLAAPMGIVLKSQFGVSNALGMLGNMANFIAYAVMGIPAGILLQKVGYKKTALIAIAIGFVGVGIQYLSGYADQSSAFIVYLLGAFIAGFSMCLLNTVVNPMLNTLGGAGNKGNQLIQIGGSFNSVMATITPMFVGVLIGEAAKARITDVFPVMYIAMGVFALVFVVLYFVNIPEPHAEKSAEPIGKLMSGALKYRHFVLGAIAIFVYVGVEVGTPGTLNLFMTTFTKEQAQSNLETYNQQSVDASYLATLTAKEKQDRDNNFKTANKIVASEKPAGLGINTATAGIITGIYWLLMLVGRLFGASIAARVSSRSMLGVTSLVGLILVLLAIFFPISYVTFPFTEIQVPINAIFLILVGLCTSIMWGGIFNLAVEGLGKYIAAASGIFMVLVCGGGLLPLLQNWVADMTNFITSYWVIVAGFAYLLYYALVGSKIINKSVE